MVLALVDDLLLGSKIRAAAQTAGRTVEFLRGRAEVVPEVRARRPDLVLIDLNRDAAGTMEAIRDLKASPDLATVRVIGFVSHVHTDRIQAAREAGIDTVMARSAFFGALPDLLRETSTDPAATS